MRAIDIRRLDRVAKKYAEIEVLLGKVLNYTYCRDEPNEKNKSIADIVCGMILKVQDEQRYVKRKIHAIKKMNDESQLIISVIKNGEEDNIPETEGEA